MWKQIFKATVIAGCLDITAASIQAYLSRGLTPDIVLKFIASGTFGKEAYSGDFKYVVFGLAVHFIIVFACVVTYFYCYPNIKLLHKNIFLRAFIIAFIAWLVTTKIIIPLSKIQPAAFNLEKAAIAILILYLCIGIPIALSAKYFYSKQVMKSRNNEQLQEQLQKHS